MRRTPQTIRLFTICSLLAFMFFTSAAASILSTVVKPSAMRHLKLDYSKPEAANQTNDLARNLTEKASEESSDVLKNTNILTIDGYGSITNWTAVSSILDNIRRLDEFHWNHNDAPPKNVLVALEGAHPDCKLFYELIFSNWDPWLKDARPIQIIDEEPDKETRALAREELVGSNSLYSIKTSIEYGASPNTESMAHLQRLIENATNLRQLDLSLSHSGCLVSHGQPSCFDFSTPETRFPPLKILKLSGYRFHGRIDGQDIWPTSRSRSQEHLRWPWKYLPEKVITNLPFEIFTWMSLEDVGDTKQNDTPNPMTNLEIWIEKMNWTALEELHVDSLSTRNLQLLAPFLRSLKSFSLDWATSQQAALLPGFLNNTTQDLEAVSLRNAKFDSLEPLFNVLVSRHSSSLKSLRLHEYDERRRVYCFENKDHPHCTNGRLSFWEDRPFINESHLVQLSSQCSNIEDLEFDIDRTLDSIAMEATIRQLGHLPRLKTLQLSFESPDFLREKTDQSNRTYRGDASRIDPLLNKTSILKIFHTIQEVQKERNQLSDKAESSTILELMNINIGSWEDRYEYGVGGPETEMRLLGHFECSAGENGTTKCTGQFRYNAWYGVDPESLSSNGLGFGEQEELDYDSL
ncbi:hypothetical protein B0O99DRAFT_673250 [Bisporella sp. PMI_857]|nr:hypothetical protein B0O99DRAFT_673250 [Bisporella sp. PMI_857]